MSTAILPPGPKKNLLFSVRKEMQENVLGLLERNARDYPNICRMKIGPYYFVNLTKPEYIEHVLSDSEKYIKGRENGNMKFLLGNGLLTNEGEFWLKQRRLIQPVFHKRRLASFVEKICTSTNAMIDDWIKRGNGLYDVHDEMTHITLGIVSQTLLSTDASGDFKKIGDALGFLMKGLSQKTSELIRLPTWVPTPFNLKMQKNRDVLDAKIYEIIATRKKDPSGFDDLLSMLMEVEDADTAEKMSDTQLRDEVITIFLAGHETTANALSFAFYLIAQNAGTGERIANEVKQVFKGEAINWEKLNELDYTTRVVKEAMRLYPPAWGIVREAAEDDIIDNYLIKKGDTLMLWPYITQRLNEYWPDPLKFDPDRFLPEAMKSKPRYAYFPFGGGARFCIGNNFAMMEMQIIVALVCSKFNFNVPVNFHLELEPLVTLRPKGGMPLEIAAY